MSSTVRSLKGLVAKRNDAAMNWLQDSTQALTDIQAKESARRIKTCERYIELLETSLTKLTKAFDEAPETTEEEEDHLDKYIEKTQATIMKLHEHRTRLEEAQEDDIGTNTDSTTSQAAGNRLPIIPIPTFTGKKWEWDNFWALYKANVHDQNLTQLQKFNYLLASLSGEAKQSVSRFFVSANNYDKAIQHLVKRYGNKDGIVLDLNRSLHNCLARGPSTTEQRQLWDKLSMIAAQLEEHEEQLNNQLTIHIFVQKFHARIRRAAMEKRLRYQEKHRSEWTLTQWLDAIDNVISQEEQLNHMLSFDGQFTGPPLHNTTTTKTLPDLEKNWNRGTLCECCGDKGHRWTTCPQIPTAIQKRRFLLEANRCLNCGSKNHRVVSCPSGSCRKCHKRHHTTICMENTPQKSGKWIKVSPESQSYTEAAETQNQPVTAANMVEDATGVIGEETSILTCGATKSATLAVVQLKKKVPTTIALDFSKNEAMKAVKAQSAASRKKKFSSISIGPDMDTHPSVSLTCTEAPVKPANVRSEMASLSSSDTETSKDTGEGTIHRLQEDFMDFKKEAEQQYQELREWVYSMCQRYDTVLTRDRRNGSDATQQNSHDEHKKTQEEVARTRQQTSKKEEKKGERNFKKQSGHLGGVATGREPQKESNSWRSITSAFKGGPKTETEHLSRNLLGEAGVYELHSYHSTSNAKRAKHSNVGHSSSDGKQSSAQKQTQKRLRNSTEVRRSHARKGVARTIITDKTPKVLSSEQISGNATGNMVHSTQFQSEVARRKGWCHTTLCAPWQGTFYERVMRCIRKTLYYKLGVLAMAFDGFRTTLTDMESESNSQWRSQQQQKNRVRYDTEGGLKKSPEEGNNLLLGNAVRPKSTHRWKTAPTVQIDEAPQKATGEAVMGDPGGSGLRRRSTHAPREIDKQGYKATRCNANEGKNPPKRSRATSNDTEVKVNNYLDDYFTINGVTPLVR